MIAFTYNNDGIYTGKIDCRMDPLETELRGENIYLLPANATYDAPPEYNPENQYPQWAGEAWEIKAIISPEPVELLPAELRGRL
jgi:hypothetical protein